MKQICGNGNFVLCTLQENGPIEKETVDQKSIPSVDTTYDFLEWYERLCDDNMKTEDVPYQCYYKQLEDRRNECISLNEQV